MWDQSDPVLVLIQVPVTPPCKSSVQTQQVFSPQNFFKSVSTKCSYFMAKRFRLADGTMSFLLLSAFRVNVLPPFCDTDQT